MAGDAFSGSPGGLVSCGAACITRARGPFLGRGEGGEQHKVALEYCLFVFVFSLIYQGCRHRPAIWHGY